MYPPFSDLSRWFPVGPWLVPVIGVTACVLAYLVGRRFLVVRSEPVVPPSEDLDPSFLGGITRDRRAAPRRRGNTVEVYLSLSPDQEAVHGWVVDRSIGGLCILTDEPLPEGVVVKVRPRGASEVTPWTEVTIRSCRREGAQYQIGCQFHRTPNWNLLLQFG